MGIILEKDFLQDIQKSSTMEWLERNNLGLYASSTCIGMNTRREHGLFIVPDKSLQKKIILLAKFEESVFHNNFIHEISTNNYSEGIYPKGYNYIEQFSINPYPKTTYNVDGRIIEKTVILLSNQPTLIVRYELKNKGGPLQLIIKPFLTNRYNTDISTELAGLNTDSYIGYKFVRWALKSEMPEIYVYHKKGEFHPSDLWYKNFNYLMDEGRHNGYHEENLFNPGFFKVTLNSYQFFDLYISAKKLEIDHFNYHTIYRSENDVRKDKKGYFVNENEFTRISKSLFKAEGKFAENNVIAVSTIENLYSTREIIFSMPAMYLINKKFVSFKTQYMNIINQLKEGLLPNKAPEMSSNYYYTAVDQSLWLIQLGYEYYLSSAEFEFFRETIYDTFIEIFEYIKKGTINNIYLDKDYLIFSGDKKTTTSWIPVLDKEGSVLRYGKLLEINALWYNALNILSVLGKELGRNLKANKFSKLAAKVKVSFLKTFLQNNNSLLDFVNNSDSNMDFRINQIIPLALPFSPLEDDTAQVVLKNIEEKLLTPHGLKVLDNKEINTKHINRKTHEYYNASIWPWTVHLYVAASLKNNDDKRGIAGKLKDYFKPLVNMINSGLIDYLPEAVTIDNEVKQEGIIDFTPSLSSVLWAYYLLNETLKSSD